MSASQLVVLAVVFGYLALSLLVGSWPGRRASGTAEGYVAGDRGMGLVLMYFITGATVFSAFAFLGGPGWAYSRGAAVFYILGYGALGFVPFYFLGPRAARVGRRFGFVTQAEMVAHRFGRPGIALVMALLSVLAFVPYLALQMKGAGYVLSAVTDGRIADWAGAAVVYGVVLIYVLRSGVLGVGWTNTLQGVFMMALAWGLGLYLPYRLYGGVETMFQGVAEARPELLLAPGLTKDGSGPWTWGAYSGAVIVSILGFSFWPHLFMKAFASRDARTLRRTVVLYPTFQIFLVPLFLIGFAGVMFRPAPEVADQILPHMLMNMDISPLLVGLFCAGALAASMSSGDAMSHAAASITIRDGVVRGCGLALSPARQRSLIRWVLLLLMILSYTVAITYRGSLVNLLLSAYGFVVQFAPGTVAALYGRRVRGSGVLAGLLAGAMVTLLFVFLPDWQPWPLHPGLYGLAANGLVLGLATLTGGKDRDRGSEFLDVAAGRAGTD